MKLRLVPREYIDGPTPGIGAIPENENAIGPRTLSIKLDRWVYERLCDGVDFDTFLTVLSSVHA